LLLKTDRIGKMKAAGDPGVRGLEGAVVEEAVVYLVCLQMQWVVVGEADHLCSEIWAPSGGTPSR
jgi:hypothetical protein